VDNLKRTVEEALSPLKSGFEADGLHLEVETVEEDVITVKLHASNATCRECLLPESQMEGMILETLQHKGIEVAAVHVMVIDSY